MQVSPPSQFLDTFQQMRGQWFAAVQGPAQTLFGLLALIEFAWSAAVLALERTDLQSWTAGLIRKLMWIGAFLRHARVWTHVDTCDCRQLHATRPTSQRRRPLAARRGVPTRPRY